MTTKALDFQVGDQVIHWVHGLGEIIKVDEKELSGETRMYYEVQIENLILFIPVDDKDSKYLRYPTPKKEFKKLFLILSSPGEPLPVDRYDRQLFLADKLEDRSLKSICLVVRDLTMHKRVDKMNESDNSTLKRARNSLLNEWSGVLSVPIQQAEMELDELLREGVTEIE